MLEKINSNIVMKDFMIKAILNPSNKDFYYKNLTISNINTLLSGMADSFVAFFWECYFDAMNRR